MTAQRTTLECFEDLLGRLAEACGEIYGERLVALAVFGSVGRGTPRPDSDVDLLLVVDPLPDGRIARVEEFAAVEARMEASLQAAAEEGLETRLSPVFKTKDEVRQRTPLLLDLVEDAKILIDRSGFLETQLAALRARLEELGARRIRRGGGWYWDLKPDYRVGEVFEL